MSEPGRLAELRDDWNGLADRAGAPFLRHEWFLNCARSLSPPDCLRVLASFSAGGLDAVAPMIVLGGGLGRRFEFLGASRLGEPCGLLYRDPAALERLARGIVALGLPCVLQRVRAEGATARSMRQVARGRGLLIVRGSAPSLRIPVQSDWNAYLDSLSPRHRYDLRRARRRAEALGSVSVRILGPDAGAVSGLLDRFMDVEASGWKGRGGSALRCRPRLRSFFTGYCLDAATQNLLRIALLDIGDDTAAAMVAVEHSGAFWVLKIGYDERYRGCSPGLMLTAETIRWAFQKGLAGYEFLGAADRWQRPWNAVPRHYESIGFFPASPRGAWALAREAARAAGTRLMGLPACYRSPARGH